MLGYFLPQATTAAHCNVARVGLDALEAIGLLATGHLMARGDRRYAATATLTGTALMVDAWFDSSPRLPGATDHSATKAQWDTPSLCAGWRVREVVAHMTMAARYPEDELMAELRRCDLSWGREAGF